MRIGTFNLNNLFGRFNFHGAVDEIEQGHDTVTVTYTFTDPDDYRLERDSHGLLVAKPADERDTLAGRIGAADLDVLAVQEVEDLDTLRRFNRDHLDGSFGHLALLEGNDPRFIDVAVLSRHPLGATTSWQHAVHPDAPGRRVFGRDLLEVEVLTPTRSRRLLRLYVGHAKSHYVDWRLRGDAREEAIEQANLRRQQQADMTAQIVQARTRPYSPYLVLGDFNDPPDSPWLAPLTEHPELQLVDGLAEPDETRPAKQDLRARPDLAGLDLPAQGPRPARHLPALRPDLAVPIAGTPADRRHHRPAHPARRRRLRPRPRLGRPSPALTDVRGACQADNHHRPARTPGSRRDTPGSPGCCRAARPPIMWRAIPTSGGTAAAWLSASLFAGFEESRDPRGPGRRVEDEVEGAVQLGEVLDVCAVAHLVVETLEFLEVFVGDVRRGTVSREGMASRSSKTSSLSPAPGHGR